MITARLAGTVDVAQIAMILFIGAVLGLFIYLRREDKREGYPLDDPAGGKPLVGFPLPPPPKLFKLIHGGTATMPHPEGRNPLPLHPATVPGNPYEPTGDPMQDGVGPASYASKKDEPIRTWEGHRQLQPLRDLPGWTFDRQDTDLRGSPVLDADGIRVGIVTDVWLDHAVKILRYLEIAITIPGAVPRAIIPIFATDIHATSHQVRVPALFARHFATFPQLREPDSITALEEDRVSAYCAGALLYGNPRRQQSVL